MDEPEEIRCNITICPHCQQAMPCWKLEGHIKMECVDALRARAEVAEASAKIWRDDFFNNPAEKREYCKGCVLPEKVKRLEEGLLIAPLKDNVVDQQFREFEAAWRAKMIEKFSVPSCILMPEGMRLIPLRETRWYRRFFQWAKKCWRRWL